MIEVAVKKHFKGISIAADFAISGSGISVLYGASGAGKSSIINMIAGLVTPESGKIGINGKTLYDSSNSINLSPDKRNAGYVFQDSRLFPHMTVRKNILYGAKAKNKPVGEGLYSQVVDLLGISQLLERYPAKLSGGEKQRVAIARALLSAPDFLLMDEPMASLDAVRRNELIDYISRLPKHFQIPIIYVTHTMEEILRLADYVGFLSEGSLIKFGPALEVLNSAEAMRITSPRNFGIILEGEVKSGGEDGGLGVVSVNGHLIEVATGGLHVGCKVRFRIPAMDVVVSKVSPTTVGRNVFHGEILEISSHDMLTDLLLSIDGGALHLWARITGKSFNEINVKPGDKIYAMVKSVVASSQFFEIG